MADKTDKKLEIAWHACAFIDILGQRSELAKFDNLPLEADLEGHPDFLELIRATYKRVQDLHDRFDETTRAFRRGVGRGVPPDQLDYWRNLTSYKTQLVHFSDGVLIDVPLALDRELLPVHGVVGLIACCANMMILQLAGHSPIRGGIDVGHAANLGRGVYYGPAIASAYSIENSFAQYPRIVIGQALLQYLATCESMTEADAKTLPHVTRPAIYAALCRSTSLIAKQLMIRDVDGRAIVHFLSPYPYRTLDRALARLLVGRSYGFVQGQCELMKQRQDSKLAFRYVQLLSYFEHFLPSLKGILGDDFVPGREPLPE